MPLFLFCLKEPWFFSIPICICINSVRKILGNQIVSTPSIKVIPFSKYLSFHLGVVLGHANWANLILYHYHCLGRHQHDSNRRAIFAGVGNFVCYLNPTQECSIARFVPYALVEIFLASYASLFIILLGTAKTVLMKRRIDILE